MCTVTIIPVPSSPIPSPRPPSTGFRLVTNRDELRSRTAAHPPRWHTLPGDQEAIYPVDPTGGGTWIAATRSGLVLCLMNANPLPAPKLPPRDDLVSRGTIIPSLIARPSVDAAMDELRALDLDRFAPFRLVGVEADDEGGEEDGFRAVEATWNRTRLAVHEQPHGLVCLVSSGLGDPLVKPRLALFEELVVAPARSAGAGVTPDQQDRFHRHTWPDRPEISVLMSRPDARTVSITTVEVTPERSDAVGAEGVIGRPHVSMTYHAVHEPVPAGPLARDAPVCKVFRPR
jgi:hypothetical protein